MVLVLVVHLVVTSADYSIVLALADGGRQTVAGSAGCRVFRHLPRLPLWLALPTRPVLPALGEGGTSTGRFGCAAQWVLCLPGPAHMGGGAGGTAARVHLALPAVVVQAGRCREVVASPCLCPRQKLERFVR